MHYTASGIITPVGGKISKFVMQNKQSKYINTRTPRYNCMPPTGVTTTDAAKYNFDLQRMSTLCSKHVEAYNKLIIKQDFVPSVG